MRYWAQSIGLLCLQISEEYHTLLVFVIISDIQAKIHDDPLPIYSSHFKSQIKT